MTTFSGRYDSNTIRLAKRIQQQSEKGISHADQVSRLFLQEQRNFFRISFIENFFLACQLMIRLP